MVLLTATFRPIVSAAKVSLAVVMNPPSSEAPAVEGFGLVGQDPQWQVLVAQDAVGEQPVERSARRAGFGAGQARHRGQRASERLGRSRQPQDRKSTRLTPV